MPLDGITTYFLTKELKTALLGGRIDKIYQPDRYDIHLLIRQDSQNLRLLLSANPSGPRIHLTTSSRENPQLPPTFCMLLRKHLSGSRITDISTPAFERIVEITIETVDELGDRKDKKLIIEMMGRYSNIILVNSESRIFDSLLHVDQKMSRVREIMPARPYAYPPEQGKLTPRAALEILSTNELPVLAESNHRPIEKALQESLLGFSPLLTREICFLASVDARKGITQLLPEEKTALIRETQTLLQSIVEDRRAPGTYSSNENAPPYDFHALLLQDAGFRKAQPSISAAIDAVHQQKDLSVDFEQKKRHLLQFCQSSLQHALRKQNVHQQDILACQDLGLYQKYGQLLLANAYQIPEGSNHYMAEDYESPDLSTVEIPLESNRSISQNAQNYFKRYSKAKAKLEASSKFLEEDDQAVEYLSTLYQAILSAADNEDLAAIKEEMQISGLLALDGKNKQFVTPKNSGNNQLQHPGKSKSGSNSSRALRAAGKAASKKAKNASKGTAPKSIATTFRQYTTSHGLQILCGRNNLQNDLLTMKTAADDDLWFHVQKMPGTHVVLRLAQKTPTEDDILEAAQTAAYFSRTANKNEKGKTNDVRQSKKAQSEWSELKIAVDYCPVKNVKKPNKAKPGMVIYDHYKTLIVSPLEPPKKTT